MMAQPSGSWFVEVNRDELIQRVSDVMPIADSLLSQRVISDEVYSNIHAAGTRQEKMRLLYGALLSKGENVKSFFYKILEEKEPFLVKDLEQHNRMKSDFGENVEGLRRKYMQLVQSEVSTVEEYNSLFGEHVELDERYTQLVLLQKHRKKEERQEELRSKGGELQKIINTRNSEEFLSTNLENLFDPDPQGFVKKTVVLQGPAGIGKSFTTLKIMSEWASGRLYGDRFDYMFLLKCQQLNLINSDVSLVDLILSCCPDLQPAIPHILSQPEKVLFLIDGFDELNLALAPQITLPINPHQKNSLGVVLSLLFSNTKSFLLITTRSTAVDKLKDLLTNPVYTEILGFSETRMEEFVNKFFKGEIHVKLALKYVREHEHVYTMCFVPVMCWIVCTVLREHFAEGTDIQHILQTNTSIFVYFVCILLKHHCKGSSLPPHEVLKCLSDLAEQGMRDGQVLLDVKAVTRTFPDVSQVPSSFLNKILLKKFVSCQTVFSFIHLTFQEFFAALSYLICEEEKAVAKVADLVKYVNLVGSTLFDNINYRNVIPFLFGLLNKKTQHSFTKEFNLCFSVAPILPLLDWVKNPFEKAHWTDITDTVFQCLYEIHEDEFVATVLENFTKVTLHLQRKDIGVASFCLQRCTNITLLDLYNCDFTGKELEKLQPALQKCKKLVLDMRHTQNDGIQVLCEVLKMGDCKIEDMQLLNSSVTDHIIDCLCYGLQNLAGLSHFCFGLKNVSDEKVGDLLTALSTRQALRSVQLVVDEITQNSASGLSTLILNCEWLETLLLKKIDFFHTDYGWGRWDLTTDLRRPDKPEKVMFIYQMVTSAEANLLSETFGIRGITMETWRLNLSKLADDETKAVLMDFGTFPALSSIKLKIDNFDETSASDLAPLLLKWVSLEEIDLRTTESFDAYDNYEEDCILNYWRDFPQYDCALCASLQRPQCPDVRLNQQFWKNSEVVHLMDKLSDEGITAKIFRFRVSDSEGLVGAVVLQQAIVELGWSIDSPTEEDLSDMVSFLQLCYKLQRLQLNVTRMSDDMAGTLLSALHTCPSLTLVELILDNLTEKEASSLAAFLVNCQALEELQLKTGFYGYMLRDKISGSEWRGEGDWDLNATLKKPNLPIKEIRYSQWNVMNKTNSEAMFLFDKLADEGFSTEACKLRVKASQGLNPAASLQNVITQVELQLKGQCLSEVVSFLHGCHRLQRLQMTEDSLSSLLGEGLQTLLPTLTTLKSLRELQLRLYCLDGPQASWIVEFLQSCSWLQELRLICDWLTSEALRVLRGSPWHLDCTITVTGWRCCHENYTCTDESQRKLSCNSHINVEISGESPTELDVEESQEKPRQTLCCCIIRCFKL